MTNDTSYAGVENLDVMTFAKNYNAWIYAWITKNIQTNWQIAEIGAGKGEFANRFETKSIDAVEIDQNFHHFINQNNYQNLYKLKKQYNLIYSINVLEHIENEQPVVKHLASLLCDDGTLKILVPARMELYSQMDKKVGHYRRYHKKELVELIQSAGLKIVDCQYFDFAGYFTTLIYKLLQRNGTISIRSIIFYDSVIFPISRFFDLITGSKIIGKNLIIEARKM